jgi:hypothetical protein
LGLDGTVIGATVSQSVKPRRVVLLLAGCLAAYVALYFALVESVYIVVPGGRSLSYRLGMGARVFAPVHWLDRTAIRRDFWACEGKYSLAPRNPAGRLLVKDARGTDAGADARQEDDGGPRDAGAGARGLSAAEARGIGDRVAAAELREQEELHRQEDESVTLRLEDYEVEAVGSGAAYAFSYRLGDRALPFFRWWGHPMHFKVVVAKGDGATVLVPGH